jgi:hypothetical protein
MFAPDALSQHKGILRANRKDQAKAGDIALDYC